MLFYLNINKSFPFTPQLPHFAFSVVLHHRQVKTVKTVKTVKLLPLCTQSFVSSKSMFSACYLKQIVININILCHFFQVYNFQ